MLIKFSNIIEKYNLNIKGIIHIGGHHGEELRDYVSAGIKDIVVFEPLNKNYDVLSRNIKYLNANITLHKTALGSKESKEVNMYVSSNDALSSSVLKPKLHLIQYSNVSFNEIEKVEMKTLDSYNYLSYNFINMDVQGYELEVLKGSRKTLEHVECVYCEVNRDEVYENNAYVNEIDEFLSLYDMKRVETNWQGETWGDALYVKNNRTDKLIELWKSIN